MEDKRIELLRNEKINKAINRMSIPAIIGLLVLGIYNVVDTMFVAWLGTEATGATQVVLPITMLVSSFGLAFGMGGGSYVSRLMGKKNHDEANRVGTVAIFSSIGTGIVFTIFAIIFMEPILTFFGASGDVMGMAKAYGLYILLGSTFAMSNMTLNNLLRAEGSAVLSMIGMATGAVLNIILDPIFIFGFGWGIEGAAIATSFSQFVTFVILVSRYVNHHSVVRVGLKYFKPSIGIYIEIFKVGIPTFLRQLLFSVSLGILNQAAVSYGGQDLLAAIGILFKVIMIPMYILFGIGQGFQPVVGYNYGAGDKERVIGALKYTFNLSLVIAVIFAVLLKVFDAEVIRIFRPSESVLNYCIMGMTFNAAAIVLMSATNTISVFYQALGKGRESLILSVARQGIFYIPAVYILPIAFGVQGVLATQLAADILTVVLTALMFIPFISSGKLDRELDLEGIEILEEA